MNAKEYAYIGDAVWELYVREIITQRNLNSRHLHKEVTSKVNAKFQQSMLIEIEESLTEEEKNLEKRARNLTVPAARKSIQTEYRMATAFEALIGYWYREDKTRLKYFEEILRKYI
jgi:ribonuclease-3 family protein